MNTPLEREQPVAAPQATIPPPPPETLPVARQLAAVLGEQEDKPIIQIARAVATLGQDKAQALSEEALKVAASEGILTKDKLTGELRKRTPGGTFFALVRKEVGEKAWRKKIKPVLSQKKALGAIGDPRALSHLDTLLATDPAEYVRDYAARALGHFPAPAVFERLLQVLHDPSTKVRCGAIVALAKTAGTQAMPFRWRGKMSPGSCILIPQAGRPMGSRLLSRRLERSISTSWRPMERLRAA